MRRLLACLLIVMAAAISRAADAEFLRVWPSYRTTESFERIGEFFGGEEKSGRQIISRTNPAERGGYYFLVRVKHAPLSGAKFVLHVIRPDAPDVRDFAFPVATAPAGESVFQLGLTGADWPGGAKSNPVAWKIELVSDDGRVLAAQKSFLWEKPAK